MSIEIMSLVLNHSKARGRAKLVLIGIANHQGDQGAWPSIATLAKYANASESSVQRDLRTLVDLGELHIEYQAAPTNYQYKTNLYWVTISGVSDFESGVSNGAVRGVRSNTSGVSPGDVQNIIKKPKETLINLTSDFEKFWNVYPRKTAKKAAFKVWSNLDADFDEVLAGALRYGNDPNLPPEIYIPHPATWLRNERWNDPMLPERVKTPEELKKIELEQIRVRREREKFLAEQERAERKRIEDDARAEPAPRCEHGRIIAACAKCIRAGKVG